MITPLRREERAIVSVWVERCRRELVGLGPDGRLASLDGVSLFWDDDMLASGTLGAYRWWRPHEIMLSAAGRHVVLLMVPALCHELHHMWQHQTRGWTYVFHACRWWNTWTTEPTAYGVQRFCERVIGQET